MYVYASALCCPGGHLAPVNSLCWHTMSRPGKSCWLQAAQSSRWFEFRKRDIRLLWSLYPEMEVPSCVRNSTPDNLDKEYMWLTAMARATGRSEQWAASVYRAVKLSSWESSGAKSKAPPGQGELWATKPSGKNLVAGCLALIQPTMSCSKFSSTAITQTSK